MSGADEGPRGPDARIVDRGRLVELLGPEGEPIATLIVDHSPGVRERAEALLREEARIRGWEVAPPPHGVGPLAPPADAGERT